MELGRIEMGGEESEEQGKEGLASYLGWRPTWDVLLVQGLLQ